MSVFIVDRSVTFVSPTWFRGIRNKAHINNLRNCFVEVYLNCLCCLSEYNVMKRGERLL